MRSSPLLLRDYFTTHLSFSAQPGFDEAKLPAEGLSPSDLDVDVQESRSEEESRRRSCQIFVSLKDDVRSKFPYNFSIALVGAFEIIPEWPENGIETLFSANAPALLYSAAREALALMTGQGPYSKVILPSVTFVTLPSESGQEASVQASLVGAENESITTKKTKKKSARKTSPE